MPFRGVSSDIVRVVVTGTDVSGKTAFWTAARDEFRGRVWGVPEAASILIGELGCQPPFEGRRLMRFQQAIAGTILLLEEEAARAARAVAERDGTRCPVLLCDRGIADGAGYLNNPEAFYHLTGMLLSEAWERYSAVLFFDPPTEAVFRRFRHDNPGRIHRTYGETMEVHERTLRAWSGHPRLVRIPSFDDWEDKLTVARDALRNLLA